MLQFIRDIQDGLGIAKKPPELDIPPNIYRTGRDQSTWAPWQKTFSLHLEVADWLQNFEDFDWDRADEFAREHKSEINLSDHNGLKPLHVAAAEANDESCVGIFVVNILLSYGAELDSRDHFGRTPLHYAVAHDSRIVAIHLLDCGALFTALTKEHQTVIHTAARYDCVEMMKGLLEWANEMYTATKGVQGEENGDGQEGEEEGDMDNEVDAVYKAFGLGQQKVWSEAVIKLRDALDIHKRSALHTAALFDMTGAAKYLVSIGADASVVDAYGKSVLFSLISRVPGAAIMALNNFMGIDKASRKRSFVLTALEPESLLTCKRRNKRNKEESILRQVNRVRGSVKGDSGGREGKDEDSLYADTISVMDEDEETSTGSSAMCDPELTAQELGFWERYFGGTQQLTHPATQKYGSYLHKVGASALQEIVKNNALNLVVHPVVNRLVDMKWKQFAKSAVVKRSLGYMLLVTLWTITAIFVPRDERSSITSQLWSFPIQIVAIVMLVVTVCHEINDMRLSYRRSKLTRSLMVTKLGQYIEKVPKDACWPDREYFLQEHYKASKRWHLADYLLDPWNYLDWTTYALLITSGVSQCIGYAFPETFHEQFNENVLNIALIAAWSKTLKMARVSSKMGPFVVMLGYMMGDVLNFVLLYLTFLIPFAVAFFNIFGDIEDGLEDYSSVYVTLMSLFRMTVIDLDYASLRQRDSIMAPILVSLWIFVSGILFINLFIAMMSNTFQVISDQSIPVAKMCHLEAVMSVQELLNFETLEKHRLCVEEKACKQNPDVETFDDDEEEDQKDKDLLFQENTAKRLDALQAMIEHFDISLEEIASKISHNANMNLDLKDDAFPSRRPSLMPRRQSSLKLVKDSQGPVALGGAAAAAAQKLKEEIDSLDTTLNDLNALKRNKMLRKQLSYRRGGGGLEGAGTQHVMGMGTSAQENDKLEEAAHHFEDHNTLDLNASLNHAKRDQVASNAVLFKPESVKDVRRGIIPAHQRRTKKRNSASNNSSNSNSDVRKPHSPLSGKVVPVDDDSMTKDNNKKEESENSQEPVEPVDDLLFRGCGEVEVDVELEEEENN
eukprot:Nk52_evm15s277 gene=Nk52_evmTU15s277